MTGTDVGWLPCRTGLEGQRSGTSSRAQGCRTGVTDLVVEARLASALADLLDVSPDVQDFWTGVYAAVDD